MHIHILGICGTFMGGIAAIARESGHTVTGCDQDVYPPMSTQLESQGIELIAGYSPEQIRLQPDIFVIGNVVTRGNPLMEEILNRNLPYISGPQWLSENILRHRWVLAVSGTHGKTTTSSMLAWILDYAGLNPGFLIGGIPENFGISARIGNTSPFFVIEADEYDTAFFDKRSKFVHYHPKTAILNNLEFDHADIFTDLSAIERQFHHFVRVIPNNGLIVANGQDPNLKHVLKQGCWTPVEEFGTESGWHTKTQTNNMIDIYCNETFHGSLQWDLLGEHNRMNALAALIAARHTGIPVNIGIEALAQFKNVKRRMEKRGTVNGISVYDDFAHHPTAIQTTIEGLRTHTGKARIIAVLEPRSNTMKMGVWKDSLAKSLSEADQVLCFTRDAHWAKDAMLPLHNKARCVDDLNQLVQAIATIAAPGDHILIMSNGGFGGIHEKILSALERT
ncbi:UDP-N-acetylmuramate:L-alanyl-gamma-D-glutamyl-meso-diaminopimelate ligase [Nitrosomonas sp. Is35]|uniref:UDP-N-acetylmuramate:L-alanyl-gamma-D-glutamyl- meso-diaminopimelate ligase n=1 Tax=unclassified Nitrosomonas TaxID=2609265 RepID=UPI00294B258D|nr:MULTISPECIES: UDP-N-acetylmuramate:L-alanyl-gamma-D-glutamyl-meso-diaminopimelate ligase [unclassified Nitrosomonas]MDV6341746.1 UDP-N-acetylmuramate:L-alanyl-gamma-D-glutamyl-meso-diaminopimelate ligase [Nitrosomonas sp. Is24]MDV6347012.1 UDP-N-acetylmuramate:L-alanyl-gamma-D-glutamyl-meso-diaminopimelate ligase [Nitrosomonas sp. Is35]